MISIITIFFTSLGLSLVLTPQVAVIARKYNIVDTPSERKVHTKIIPRAGGVAIYLAFVLTFLATLIYPTAVFELLFDRQAISFLIGASLAFLLGLWDDVKPLNSKIKLAIQILIACIVYTGGLKIRAVSIFALHSEWVSLAITVFWFVLVMNAINLIDGLDGLAAGITLFVSLVLLVICIKTNRLQAALGFAALGGATLGFLKYNFNPASIFMGDSGSYFLGYSLASLSIMGSVKAPATVASLIPVIALGLPLMDVMFAPIRRFFLGQKIFSPDKNHLHHRLLRLGFTHKNAVFFLYGTCVFMGLLAILMVHSNDEGNSLILMILAPAVILGVRQLGYADYFGPGKFYDWVKDITDEMGISYERRSFLNFEVEIYQSGDMKTLWINICKALEKLGFDTAEMYLEQKAIWCNLRRTLEKLGLDTSGVILAVGENGNHKMVWAREGFSVNIDSYNDSLMTIELPLICDDGQSFGTMWLVKDVRRERIAHSTLRRVEHLRRTVLSSLKTLVGTAPC